MLIPKSSFFTCFCLLVVCLFFERAPLSPVNTSGPGVCKGGQSAYSQTLGKFSLDFHGISASTKGGMGAFA